jgi:nicotinamide phosphoribosyltransferase
MKNLSAMLLCDFYKLSHREQYPENTEVVYSTWTPRASRVEDIDKVVSFGQQAFIKDYLIEFFNENFFSRT